MQRLPIVLILLLLFLSIQTQELFAYRTSHVYGISTTRFVGSLWRVNLKTGTLDLIAEVPVPSLHQDGLQAVIDNHSDLYCYIERPDRVKQDAELVTIELLSGNIKAKHTLPSGKYLSMRLSPKNGLIYVLFKPEGELDFFLLEINPRSGATRTVQQLPAGFTPSMCTGIFDIVDGQYHAVRTVVNATDIKKVWVYDVENGELLKTYELPNDMTVTIYDPSEDAIFSLTKLREDGELNGSFADLQRFDPDTEELTRLGTVSFPRGSGTLSHCHTGFDVTLRKMFVVSSYWLTIIDLEAQESTLEYLGEQNADYRQLTLIASYPADSSEADSYLQRLEARVVHDLDVNCSYDARNDDLMQGYAIDVSPSDQVLFSGTNGKAITYLPEGEYSLRVRAPEWLQDCSSQPISLTSEGQAQVPADLLLKPKASVRRLELSLVCRGEAEPGERTRFVLHCHNTGTLTYNGKVRMQLNPLVEVLAIAPQPLEVNPQELVWAVEGLRPGHTMRIGVTVQVPDRRDILGQELCAQAGLLQPRSDLLLRDEMSECCLLIRERPPVEQPRDDEGRPYDPNDITVSPAGFGDEGLVVTDVSTLVYRIRFQNIGTGDAKNVIILDTLDANMDVNTLQFGAATHDYTVSLLQGNILEFRFIGINLPYESKDEPGSHGALKYRIDLNKGLPVGTQIRNSAAIYFDNEAPVITNTELTTLGDGITDIEEANPGDSYKTKLELRSLGQGHFVCRLSTPYDSLRRVLNGKLQVFSVLGSKVFETSLKNQTEVSIDLGAQPSGRYLIRLELSGEIFVKSVSLMR